MHQALEKRENDSSFASICFAAIVFLHLCIICVAYNLFVRCCLVVFKLNRWTNLSHLWGWNKIIRSLRDKVGYLGLSLR